MVVMQRAKLRTPKCAHNRRPAGMTIAPLTTERPIQIQQGDLVMLWTICVILLVLWLLGLIGHIGGGLIHILLVVAVVILIINLVSGRRAVLLPFSAKTGRVLA